MATITPTQMGSGDSVLTVVTLTGTDDFVYTAAKKPVLVLDNVTGGALTVVIDGDGGTTVSVDGVGDVDVSSGFSTASIAAGSKVAIPLYSINKYLQGTIAVTGGTGIEASLLEF